MGAGGVVVCPHKAFAKTRCATRCMWRAGCVVERRGEGEGRRDGKVQAGFLTYAQWWASGGPNE
jgi:hypothetical protein